MSLNEWWLVGAIRLSSPKKQTVHSKRIKNIVFQTHFWRNQAKNHYESLWITIISDVCFSCDGWICSMLFLWVADMLKFFSSHCSCSFSRNRMVLQYLEVGSSTFLMLDSFALDCRLSWFSDSNSLSLNQKKMSFNQKTYKYSPKWLTPQWFMVISSWVGPWCRWVVLSNFPRSGSFWDLSGARGSGPVAVPWSSGVSGWMVISLSNRHEFHLNVICLSFQCFDVPTLFKGWWMVGEGWGDLTWMSCSGWCHGSSFKAHLQPPMSLMPCIL